jgi:hypothetical protein
MHVSATHHAALQETNVDLSCDVDLIELQLKSPLLVIGSELSRELYSDSYVQYIDELSPHSDRVKTLHASLKWINVQATLLDICIAFHPLDLPPYIVMEIVDKFPFWSTHVNRKKKIDYIVQIKRFCDELIDAREY